MCDTEFRFYELEFIQSEFAYVKQELHNSELINLKNKNVRFIKNITKRKRWLVQNQTK